MSTSRLFGVFGCLLLAVSLNGQSTDTTNTRESEKAGRMRLVRDPDELKRNAEAIWAARLAQAGHFLSFGVEGSYDSNTLYNQLIVGLWRGGYLSHDIRETSQAALNGNNRAGSEASINISYAWGDSLFGNGSLRPRVSVGYHDLTGMRFADDLYNLTFFGNAAYEYKTASLAPSEYEQVRYQTFGFGVEEKRSRSFIQLELVNGQSLRAAVIDRADLFTGTDGRFLELSIDGTYQRSDTTDDGIGRSHGLGGALSAEFNRTMTIRHHSFPLTFGVQDLGFIAWNANSLRLSKDTVIHYEGMHVADVLDLNGALSGSADLKDTLALNYQRGGFLRALPALFFARMSTSSMNGLWQYQFRVGYRFVTGYRPLVSLLAHRKLSDRFSASSELSYGGFGALRFGIGAEATVMHRVKLNLHTPNLIGLISNEVRGKALMLGVEITW